jgi:hypothetical protein
MSKYSTLVNILDRLRSEAPKEFTSYHALSTDIPKLDYARSKAFIHLFLKVRFGLLEFDERESFVTDGGYDGGVDAYYIDTETKTIFLIQSKFRTNAENFEGKQINLKEILKIDADRISEGETENEDGNEYNGKIQRMLKKIQEIPDTARYKWQVILLANLKDVKPSDLKKLTGGISASVFDFERTYGDLVFPVVSGTFFNIADLFIKLNLTNKELSQSRINYPVTTEQATCEITIIFVPTLEIASVLHKYKNSILKFNPRSYLDLQTNPVNREIASTVTEKNSNEFALFNNGITILSDETNLNEKIGQKSKGQLHIKNPQIINGGQTAFTLCRIYEQRTEQRQPLDVFENKEVMLKVITLPPGQANDDGKLQLIESISKATNQQTAVSEADRRSNDKIQIELQGNLFSTFGYFYERKRGEFLDGIRLGYIDNSRIIDRELGMRICSTLKGQVSQARRQGAKKFFTKAAFDKLLDESMSFKAIFFGFRCLDYLYTLEHGFASTPNNKYGIANYGQGLRYGKYAIVFATSKAHSDQMPTADYELKVKEETDKVLARWKAFESHVIQLPHNSTYFFEIKDPTTGQKILEVNFDGYYKGSTLDRDLKAFKF